MTKIHDSSNALEIKSGTFSWDLKGANIVLSDINLKIPKGMANPFRYCPREINNSSASCFSSNGVYYFVGKLTAIVGAVGSGKSSLLCAMIAEMTKVNGSVFWNR